MKDLMKLKSATRLTVILMALLAVTGCGTELDKKTCDYCGGRIAWQQLDSGGFSTRYGQEYEEDGGKYYHKWCFKHLEYHAHGGS